jgi:hypothetical protein
VALPLLEAELEVQQKAATTTGKQRWWARRARARALRQAARVRLLRGPPLRCSRKARGFASAPVKGPWRRNNGRKGGDIARRPASRGNKGRKDDAACLLLPSSSSSPRKRRGRRRSGHHPRHTHTSSSRAIATAPL